MDRCDHFLAHGGGLRHHGSEGGHTPFRGCRRAVHQCPCGGCDAPKRMQHHHSSASRGEVEHRSALAIQAAIDVGAKVDSEDAVSVSAVHRTTTAADLFTDAFSTYRRCATPPLTLSPVEHTATHRGIHEAVQVLEGGGNLALDETFLEQYQDCLYVEQDPRLHCTLMQRIEECSRWRGSLSAPIEPKRKRNRRKKRS